MTHFIASTRRVILGAIAVLVLVGVFAILGVSGEQAVAASVLLVGLAWTLRGESLRALRGLKLAEFLAMLFIAAVAFGMSFVTNLELSFTDVLLLKGRFYSVAVGYTFLILAIVGALINLFPPSAGSQAEDDAA